MQISVFGAGYVGLVAAACLADVGHDVVCVDNDAAKIRSLQAKEIPIYEPGLDVLVAANHDAGRLKFTGDAGTAVAFGQIIFIAVGTPPGEDGSADLGYVVEVARTIGRHMDGYKLVVNKSTVPVGTAQRVREEIEAVLNDRGVHPLFDVCSNPEFMKEGAAIEDFTRGARIVVGTDSDKVRELMRECYAPYNRNHDKLMFMDVRSAELTKYAANAMLATKISFINEIANLAERLGADVEQVRRGIGSDPRIGYDFIYPGCGYGGSCFPKDIQALIRTAQSVGYAPGLLTAVEQVNHRQKAVLFSKVSEAMHGDLAGRTIAVWGLAFKPNTDDVRAAPSLELLEALWAAGAKVRAYDPGAMKEIRRIYGEHPGLVLVESRDAAVEDADALVICTEWKAFRTVDFPRLARSLRQSVIIDGRNLFDPQAVARHGLRYFAIGRGQATMEEIESMV